VTQTQPDFAMIEEARSRIAGYANLTPLLRAPALDRATGARTFIKAENLQRTGSFKFRGAMHFLSRIPEAERPSGVVAYSSGNHAQAIAEAARILDMRATIVAPSDAPVDKLRGVLHRGARLVTYDRATESREAIGIRIANEEGATLVPPFDHPWTIAGQGTIGPECVEQARAMDVRFDRVLCCASGGGLIAGLSLGLHHYDPDLAIHAVEPAGFDDIARSLATGRKQRNPAASGSLCDALLTQTPGELTWPIIQHHVQSGVAVTDGEALSAVTFAFRHLRLVLEPGGAVAVAAALFQKLDLRDQTVLIIASGGNISPQVFARALDPLLH
jgi:threonine dehydratase